MSLAEGDNHPPGRDSQLDLSFQIRKEYGENIFVDISNEEHYRRIIAADKGGIFALPKCLTRDENGKIKLKKP